MTSSKSCSYCGSEIPIRATVCPVCKYHQTRWRNNLLFIAGLAGLITLFVSGLAFTIDRLSLAYKNVVWQDRISVLTFYSAGQHFDFVIGNGGDGPIFVSDIVITSAGNTRPEMSKNIGEEVDGFGTKFCFLLVHFKEDSPALTMMKQYYSQHGGNVVSLPAVAHVGFFSPHSKTRIEEKFAVTGALLRHPTCRPKS